MQFIVIKINPVIIVGDTETADCSFPVWFSNARNANPNPIRILKTGPAKQAVIAILAKPLEKIVV